MKVVLSKMSQAGDEVVVEWDGDQQNEQEIMNAFADLRAKGCLIYLVEESSGTFKKTGTQVLEFEEVKDRLTEEQEALAREVADEINANPQLAQKFQDTILQLIARPAFSGG